MKIILATPVYPPEVSSLATYIKQLALKLRDKHEVTIVAYASTSERIDGTTLRTVSKQRQLPFRLLKYFITLYKASRGADVIYVQNAMVAGLPAVFVGKLRQIKVVLKFVGDEAWEHAIRAGQTKKNLEEFFAKPDGGLRTQIRIAIQGFVLRNANVVLAPSSYLRDVIAKKYRLKNERVFVNYDAAIIDPTAPFPAIRKPHQVVVSSDGSESTGLEKIIHAVAILKKKYSDLHTIIIGDQPKAEIKNLAAELGLADWIQFTGYISRTEISHIQKSSEVCVLNSNYELLPNAVLTSFSAGTPVITVDVSGVNEVVKNNVSGLIVPTKNEADYEVALAAAVGKIFDNKVLRVNLVTEGEIILKEKFSWEAHLKTLLGFFA